MHTTLRTQGSTSTVFSSNAGICICTTAVCVCCRSCALVALSLLLLIRVVVRAVVVAADIVEVPRAAVWTFFIWWRCGCARRDVTRRLSLVVIRLRHAATVVLLSTCACAVEATSIPYLFGNQHSVVYSRIYTSAGKSTNNSFLI